MASCSCHRVKQIAEHSKHEQAKEQPVVMVISQPVSRYWHQRRRYAAYDVTTAAGKQVITQRQSQQTETRHRCRWCQLPPRQCSASYKRRVLSWCCTHNGTSSPEEGVTGINTVTQNVINGYRVQSLLTSYTYNVDNGVVPLRDDKRETNATVDQTTRANANQRTSFNAAISNRADTRVIRPDHIPSCRRVNVGASAFIVRTISYAVERRRHQTTKKQRTWYDNNAKRAKGARHRSEYNANISIAEQQSNTSSEITTTSSIPASIASSIMANRHNRSSPHHNSKHTASAHRLHHQHTTKNVSS